MSDIKKLAERLEEVRTQLSELSAKQRELNEIKDELERAMIDELEKLGVDSLKINGKSYAAKVDIMPTVEDWDAFYRYVKENDAFYLLQRRTSATAFRELNELGEEVPGVVPTPVTKLQARKA